jgi:hypothetical protein
LPNPDDYLSLFLNMEEELLRQDNFLRELSGMSSINFLDSGEPLSPENLIDLIFWYYSKSEVKRNYRPNWLKNPKTGRNLELDFYLEKKKIAVEVQGFHHKTIYQEEKDKIKEDICKERGIRLIKTSNAKINTFYYIIRTIFNKPFKKIPAWIVLEMKKTSLKYNRGFIKKQIMNQKKNNKFGYFRITDIRLWKEVGVREQNKEKEICSNLLKQFNKV